MGEPRAFAADDWLSFAASGSEMGELVAVTDWSSTPLGDPATWPHALRAAVTVCLTSRFPMLVVWGPELTQIYNDAYRPILGAAKHPEAMGAPAKQVWAEVWDQIGPEFDEVMRTGTATWHSDEPLVIERHGFPEECWFTWSYSPLLDDDGVVGGVLDTVVETTRAIVSRRRLHCVTAVSEALFGAAQVTDVCLRAASALRDDDDDITGADIYLRIGQQHPLVASSRRGALPDVSPEIIADVAESGTLRVLGGEVDGRPAHHLVVPVDGGHGGISGVMVASLNPCRPLDDDHVDFVRHVAATIGSALEAAYRRSVEVDAYRSISETLQNAMLTPVRDFPTVAARYVPATGRLSVGGDWYDVIELDDHRRGLVVGDCVGHGLTAAAAMGQLRSAARAMMLDDNDPATTVMALDRFAESTENAFGTTVVCAVIDRRDKTLTYSRAGHPPPLLVTDEGIRWLDGEGGPPLATIPDAPRTNHSMPLRNGDIVILYTDGLVERRGEVIDEGLARLEEAVQDARSLPVHEVADTVMQRVLAEEPADDVVLVVKRLEV